MSLESRKEIVIPREASWAEVEDWTLQLAQEIHNSGFKPDFCTGISRGGWEPAILLSRMLGGSGYYQ